ncbi:hypothetical protein BAE44_0018510 [Dichanthelium oligosanthes]|uniref:Uncharacterized protein n=1 Tax=Dichanthelium oligosanthes TaxID=888268 RepID=A0A1E5V650_9POAL|nr:hypothetical protein BAE44_0018510 [Dichanthelium oligosanthes]
MQPFAKKIYIISLQIHARSCIIFISTNVILVVSVS